MQNKYLTRIISFFLFLFTISTPTLAGIASSLMQGANAVPVKKFLLKGQADIIFNQGGGFNFSPHLVTGVIDQIMDVDFYIGTGTTEFQAGGLLKYNLFPDIPSQIGVSFLGGGTYIFNSTAAGDVNGFLLTFGTLVSKNFDVEFGKVDPYLSFQFEFFFNSSATTVPLTLILGSRFDPSELAPWHFYGEFSFGLKDSYYSFALGAGYPF